MLCIPHPPYLFLTPVYLLWALCHTSYSIPVSHEHTCECHSGGTPGAQPSGHGWLVWTRNDRVDVELSDYDCDEPEGTPAA